MKVAYDYQIFGYQRFGGISRYFYELARHLSRLKIEEVSCRIISPIFINEYLRSSKEECEVFGLHLPDIHHSKRLYRSINRVLSAIEFSRWGPSIVHETYYIRKRYTPSKTHTVVTVFDMIHELYPQYFTIADRTREIKRVVVERADHIICISENTREDLIRILGVAPEKTTVIPLAASVEYKQGSFLTLHGRPFILYVGLRGGYKNFVHLLKAYASRSDLYHHYDLIAFGGGCFTKTEIELMSHLKIPLGRIRQISGTDCFLAELYKNASIYVCPSLYEGFGIPPLEAMSFSCPVACSSTSSLPEVVGDAAVLFDPLSVDSIAAALSAVLYDSELRTALVQRGRLRSRLFSWEECAIKTLDVYRRVLI